MKIIFSAIVSAFLLAACVPKAAGQSAEQFLAIHNMTTLFFDRDPGLVRRLVRMAFHDSMGGMDGHLDLNNTEHDGLAGTFRLLNRLWEHNAMLGNETEHDMERFGNGTMGGGQGQGQGQGQGGGGLRPQGGGDRGDRGGGGGGGGGGRRLQGGGGGGQPGRGPPGMRGNNTGMGPGRGGRGGRNATAMFLMGLEPVSVEGLTKADFFAWVYTSAFYHTVPGRNVPWIPLRFGRTTAHEAQLEDTPPLSAFGSHDRAAVLEYFDEHYGFNEGQVAVLMGAHTLGGANRGNSGFTGTWTSSPGVFNNEYYENLMFPGGRGGWEQIAVRNSTLFEWRWGCNNRCRDLMLNVDMNLFYDLDDYFVGDAGQVMLPDPLPATAPPGLCSDPEHVFAVCFPEREGSATHQLITFLEDGNGEMFLDNFATVFGDMLSRVKDDAPLGYVASPHDWPRGLNRGRGGPGGRGRGPPPRGCNVDNNPDAIAAMMGEDGEEEPGFELDFDFDEEVEGVDVEVEDVEGLDIEVTATRTASDPKEVAQKLSFTIFP